jgi:hypothetical protein
VKFSDSIYIAKIPSRLLPNFPDMKLTKSFLLISIVFGLSFILKARCIRCDAPDGRIGFCMGPLHCYETFEWQATNDTVNCRGVCFTNQINKANKKRIKFVASFPGSDIRMEHKQIRILVEHMMVLIVEYSEDMERLPVYAAAEKRVCSIVMEVALLSLINSARVNIIVWNVR